MNKTRKSAQAQDSSKSSATSNSQVSLFPTAKSPSLTTATDSIDPRNVPTAVSRSTKTGIGANTSDFERPNGMSDTSAGSSQQNSKIEAATALTATSPQLLLNDLRRGQLFGKQSQSQSQQTGSENNNQTISTTTFTSTTFTSTASELSESEDSSSSSFEKSTQPESSAKSAKSAKTAKSTQPELSLKSAKSTKSARSGSRILSILEKKREKNNIKNGNSVNTQSGKSFKKSKKKGSSGKMVKSKNRSGSSKKTKKNRVKNNDDSSKRVPAVHIIVPTNTSCSDAATSNSSFSSAKSKRKEQPVASKEFPEVAGISTSNRQARRKNENVDESVRMANYPTLDNGLTDISKKKPAAQSGVAYPQGIQSQRYPLIPGQSPSLTNLSARAPVQENFAPGPISKQSVRYPLPQQQQPMTGMQGQQKTLRSAPRMAKKQQEHHFPGNGRSLKTVAQPTEMKPIDGSLKDPCVYDISNLNNSQRRLPPKAPPRSLFGAARPQPQKSKQAEPSGGNKVVIYGTTADGKNQVEFIVQMRIVAGEAVGANQNQPVDVLPKKIVVGGKEISVDKNQNESMNL